MKNQSRVMAVSPDKDYTLGLLDDQGRLAARPCKEYDLHTHEDLRLFCHYQARYLLPTTELLDYLKPLIANRKTIEIGAGTGDLGRALNIDMYDSFLQRDNKDVVEGFRLIQQPTIKYGSDVVKMTALEAVKKIKPEVVIASWVTQWCEPEKTQLQGGGSIYGIKEHRIIETVETYILIGSDGVHGQKYIMKLPHIKIDAPFVRSRCEDNKIWIWSKEIF